MCTVTYIPTEGGFAFTSSRDERYDRRDTAFPSDIASRTGKVFFPRDLESKGTWVALSSKRIHCLLNGAFVKHQRLDNYKKSRGIMLLEAFDYESIHGFVNQYDFLGMEPFTMISVEISGEGVFELRWDGAQTHLKEVDVSQSHIWSSATLYTKEAILRREQWFGEWWNQYPPNHQNLRLFHYKGGVQPDYDSVLLKRETKGTISISSIEKRADGLTFYYDDFERGLRKHDIPVDELIQGI